MNSASNYVLTVSTVDSAGFEVGSSMKERLVAAELATLLESESEH